MPIDRITEPQEWIDGLLKVYAPNSEDIDVALQNMGLRIKQAEILLKDINDYLNINNQTNIGHGSILHKDIISFLET